MWRGSTAAQAVSNTSCDVTIPRLFSIIRGTFKFSWKGCRLLNFPGGRAVLRRAAANALLSDTGRGRLPLLVLGARGERPWRGVYFCLAVLASARASARASAPDRDEQMNTAPPGLGPGAWGHAGWLGVA